MNRWMLRRRVDAEAVRRAIEEAESRTSGEIRVSVSTFFFGNVRRTAEAAFVRLGMNRDYGVLNGEREAEDFFLTGLEPADDVRAVLLFTDGLDIPCEAPQKRKDFSELVDRHRELGLPGLRDHVRSLEAADPDIERYPRFKRHDDMAAIAIHF